MINRRESEFSCKRITVGAMPATQSPGAALATRAVADGLLASVDPLLVRAVERA
jgi:hypothetical protein